MIESLLLKNFQKHRLFSVEFENITTFVGDTRAGKSSILRALRWVCLNKPTGDRLIRHGTKAAKARIVIDGQTVERYRGKENTYALNGDEYKAFSITVPKEIDSLINMSDLSFQTQVDLGEANSRPTFWFALSPGQLSKELNDLAGLSSIDSSLSYALTTLKRAKAQYDAASERKRKLVAEVKALRWVTEADRRLRQIEKLQERLDATTQRADALSELLDEIDELEKLRSTPIPDLSNLDKLVKRLRQTRKRKEELRSLLEEIQSHRRDLCHLQKQLRATRKQLASVKTCPTCGRVMEK